MMLKKMSAKTTSVFLKELQSFEAELTTRLRELKDVATRETTSLSRRPIKLGWIDEVKELEENISTQMEFSRSTVRLDLLLATAESAADSLEAVLIRAEDLASAKFDYVAEAPKMMIKETSKAIPAASTLSSSPLRQISINTPLKMSKTPKAVRTPKTGMRMTISNEPPTPKLEDLGLSSATLNLLRKRG